MHPEALAWGSCQAAPHVSQEVRRALKVEAWVPFGQAGHVNSCPTSVPGGQMIGGGEGEAELLGAVEGVGGGEGRAEALGALEGV